MAASVRPTRLAWRGLGAADPSGQAGADGVDFEIARLRPPQEPAIADDGSPVVLPWNGETVPPPALGDGLLSAAGDPILRRVTRTAEGETLPSGESFREALDGDDEEETP
jgi:hypothetical protein